MTRIAFQNIILAFIILVFFSSATYATPGYEVVDLGLGAARYINSIGQVVGSPGIGDLEWGDDGVAYGVNDFNNVVGSYLYGNQDFIWSETQGMQNLGTLGGFWSYAFAINNSNQVVGASRYHPSDGDYPVLLPAPLHMDSRKSMLWLLGA